MSIVFLVASFLFVLLVAVILLRGNKPAYVRDMARGRNGLSQHADKNVYARNVQ